jgi:hypothetical protein
MKRSKILSFSLPIVLGIIAISNSTLFTNKDLVEAKAKTTLNQVITTGQTHCYDNSGKEINPQKKDSYYGQDANYKEGLPFSFTNNNDGTITDNNTHLMWQQLPSDQQFTWQKAKEYAENLTLGGYSDWRLPTVEEAWSIQDFSEGWPYVNKNYFKFPKSKGLDGPPTTNATPLMLSKGEPGYDERKEMLPPPPIGNIPDKKMLGESFKAPKGIDKSMQFWTSNIYKVGLTHGNQPTAFGVNEATGHIKGYPSKIKRMGKYVRVVRGPKYGVSEFIDNNDGTITDKTSGLMWSKNDSKKAMTWKEALAYAQNSKLAGYNDWRLPNVKELQSIVDYSGIYPAINKYYFKLTKLEENPNYYFWTSTSAYFSKMEPEYSYAWYVAFGYAVSNDGKDIHGAGAVRFAPKSKDIKLSGMQAMAKGEYTTLNSVLLVRNAKN